MKKVETLMQALPYIRRHRGKTFLVKLGGAVADEKNGLAGLAQDLSMLMQRILKEDGIPPGRLPEFRKYLGQVTNETARVGRIVSDLLAFSRRGKPQQAQAVGEVGQPARRPVLPCSRSARSS